MLFTCINLVSSTYSQVLRGALTRLQLLYPQLSEQLSSAARVPVRGEVDYTRRLELYRRTIQLTR